MEVNRNMLKYAVVSDEGRLIRIINDTTWKEYDIRQCTIMHWHEYIKTVNPPPIAIIKALKIESGKLIDFYYPVFLLTDLDNVFLSKSGHLVLEKQLTTQQQLWINNEREGRKLLE